MRRRPRRMLPGDADRGMRLAFRVAALAAGLGVLGSLLVLGRIAYRGGFDPGPWLAALALVVAPVLGSLKPARMRRVLGFEGPHPVLFVLAQVVAVIALGVRAPVAVVPAVLILLQVHLLVGFARDISAAWSPAVSVMQAVAAVALAPGPATALLLPLAVAASVAARVVAHARLAHGAVARRVRAHETPRESRSGLRGRLVYALPVAALLVLVTTLLYPLAARPPWSLASGAGDGAAEAQRRAEQERRGGPIEDGGAGPMSFSAEMATNGIPMPAYEVLMEVEPRLGGAPAGRQGALHLRGIVLSEMTAVGARMRAKSAPPLYDDAADGEIDGWTTIAPAPAGTEPLELVVSQYPLPIEPEGWNVLFATYPLYSVSVDRVRFDSDRLLLSDEVPADWFSYSVLVRRPGAPLPGLANAPARIDNDRFVQLPPDSPELRWLSGEARTITQGATTDHERVQAFMRHFRRGYQYSLEGTEFGGVRGVVEFMERRSGFCTYYASATVLMLRTLGIPARIASGFLVQEWDDEVGIYRVRPRDTHAWVEVHFEGVGWVTFDPTPPDARRAAIDEDDDEAGAGQWAAHALDSLGRWAASGGQDVSASEVVRVLLSAPRTIAWLAASFVLSLLVIFVARAVARRRRGVRRASDPVHREADDLYGRLLSALRRHGYRKRAAQTPREFAAAVAHAGGVAFRPLRGITEALYAVRYGGRPLERALHERVDTFVRELSRAR